MFRSARQQSSPRQRALIALPACACSLIDSVSTLLAQPATYWSDPATGHENNPKFAWLLHAGPGWFIVGELVWCAVVVGVVTMLPGVLSLLVAVAVSIGHTYGALTWIITVVPILGLYPVFAVFGLAPIVQTVMYLRPRLSSAERLYTFGEAGDTVSARGGFRPIT